MMGDAAHASTPFQGQGAAQAIEDSLCLAALLGKVQPPDQIPLAFRAYDKIRRPRSQKVTSTSWEAGELVSTRASGSGRRCRSDQEESGMADRLVMRTATLPGERATRLYLSSRTWLMVKASINSVFKNEVYYYT